MLRKLQMVSRVLLASIFVLPVLEGIYLNTDGFTFLIVLAILSLISYGVLKSRMGPAPPPRRQMGRSERKPLLPGSERKP